MPRLLIVHHTPSPFCQELFESVVAGATTPDITGVEVICRAALQACEQDFLNADGYLLGTPVNFGYISGALKHAFDTCYYPILDTTPGRPFGAWFHGDQGTEGAQRALTSLTTGLGWSLCADYVVVCGKPTAEDRQACWELGATLAATLAP